VGRLETVELRAVAVECTLGDEAKEMDFKKLGEGMTEKESARDGRGDPELESVCELEIEGELVREGEDEIEIVLVRLLDPERLTEEDWLMDGVQDTELVLLEEAVGEGVSR